MKYHFSGYATKFNVKCTDGRVILPGAFAHNDKKKVPIMWQHRHNEPTNVVGNCILEHRDDGVYAYGHFNDTVYGRHCRALVAHGDIEALSIFARRIKEQSKVVKHGDITEVSLVITGANPEALIDYVNIQHADSGEDVVDGECHITINIPDDEILHGDLESEFELVEDGEVIEHADEHGNTYDEVDKKESDEEDENLEHADDEMSIKEAFDSMNAEQQMATMALVTQALQEGAKGEEFDEDIKQSDDDENNLEHSDDEGGNQRMKKNVFVNGAGEVVSTPHLAHSDIVTILKKAQNSSSSVREVFLAHIDGHEHADQFQEAILAHAGGETYGIKDIDILFPDAQAIDAVPAWDKRDTHWVPKVLNAVHKRPFSRIKNVFADIKEPEARAKGYITGNEKTEEVFKLFKRVTNPTTIYKKQKLDRDDIADITDFNIVAWLKAEMRMMLDEELARAILIGDGRSYGDADKIDETCIRPIYTDDPKYSVKKTLAPAATPLEQLEAFKIARKEYKGSGSPSLFTTAAQLIDWTLIKDKQDRYMFPDAAAVAKFLNVKEIIEVEVMENVNREEDAKTLDLIGMIVNLTDYSVGATKGGKVAMFDDFDIDFNQQKYLIETRCSGALTKLYSALVVEIERAG